LKKIIFFFLGCFFFSQSVFASEEEQFLKNIYQKTYDRIRKEREVISQQIFMDSTGLSLPDMKYLENPTDTQDFTAVKKFCNEEFSLFLNTECEQELKEFLYFEQLLTETFLDSYTVSSSQNIFQNGTLKDSPYDLVVDLNRIEVLLFGSEAEIPFAQYEKKREHQEFSYPLSVKQRFSAFFEDSLLSPSLSSESLENFQTNEKQGGIQTEFLDAGEIVSVKDIFLSDEFGTEELVCVHPNDIVFLDFTDSSFTEKNSSDSLFPSDEMKVSISEETPLSDDFSKYLSPYQFSKTEIPKNLGDSRKEECETTKYGGYYCKKKEEKPKQCDDPKTNASDFFRITTNFCIKVSFVSAQNSLFSSLRVEDSLLGYIKSSQEAYESLLKHTPLNPKKNTNQAGRITQKFGLSQNLSFSIDIQPKYISLGKNEIRPLGEPEKLLAETSDQMLSVCEGIEKINIADQEGDFTISDMVSDQDTLDSLQFYCRESAREVLEKQINTKTRVHSFDTTETLLASFTHTFQTSLIDVFASFPFEEIIAVRKACE
jgi:hypothetical protein